MAAAGVGALCANRRHGRFVAWPNAIPADVDLIIQADVPRALELARSLEGTNFKPLFEEFAEVVERAFILPIRHRTTNVKVDMALGLSGFERQAITRSENLEISGELVAVATAEDLLIMKLLAGRPQDDQDVRGLVATQRGRLDWGYCSTIAQELGESLDIDLYSRILSLRTE